MYQRKGNRPVWVFFDWVPVSACKRNQWCGSFWYQWKDVVILALFLKIWYMFSSLCIRIISLTIDGNSFDRVWGEVTHKALYLKKDRERFKVMENWNGCCSLLLKYQFFWIFCMYLWLYDKCMESPFSDTLLVVCSPQIENYWFLSL